MPGVMPSDTGYPRRVFKAVVCFMLFFIAVGAIGMWMATQRRER
jgi:hypothetical protein